VLFDIEQAFVRLCSSGTAISIQSSDIKELGDLSHLEHESHSGRTWSK
jgi:hypothetical protein